MFVFETKLTSFSMGQFIFFTYHIVFSS